MKSLVLVPVLILALLAQLRGQSAFAVAYGIDSWDEYVVDQLGSERLINHENKFGVTFSRNVISSLSIGLNYTFSQGAIEPKVFSSVRTWNKKTFNSFGLDFQYDWRSFRRVTPLISLRLLSSPDYPYRLSTYEKLTCWGYNYQIGGGVAVRLSSQFEAFGRYSFGQVLVHEDKGGLVEEQSIVDLGVKFKFSAFRKD